MKNTISCGRTYKKEKESIGEKYIPRMHGIRSFGSTQRDKRETAVSALLLFGAMICTLWLCHFPDRRSVDTENDRGASALSEYEVIEVFGEFGANPSPTVNKNDDDGWTLSGYFKEFFSALLGV